MSVAWRLVPCSVLGVSWREGGLAVAIAVGCLRADVVPVAGRTLVGILAGSGVVVVASVLRAARGVALIVVSLIRASWVARGVDEGL